MSRFPLLGPVSIALLMCGCGWLAGCGGNASAPETPPPAPFTAEGATVNGAVLDGAPVLLGQPLTFRGRLVPGDSAFTPTVGLLKVRARGEPPVVVGTEPVRFPAEGQNRFEVRLEPLTRARPGAFDVVMVVQGQGRNAEVALGSVTIAE